MFSSKVKPFHRLVAYINAKSVSYLIYDTDLAAVIHKESEKFNDEISLKQSLLAWLEKFPKSSVSIENKLFTLIPTAIVKKEILTELWNTNFGVQLEKVNSETINEIDSTLLSNALFSKDQLAKLPILNIHSQTFFTIQHLLKNSSSNPTILLKKYDTYIHLFLMKDGRLQLANNFAFENTNDICYFTLLAAQQTNLDLSLSTLYYVSEDLSFETEKEIFYPYIQNIKAHAYGSEFDLLIQTEYL